jgi:hypothetical protein
MKKNNVLGKYASNVFSQFGEDGILQKVFEILPNGNKWCVEFGAWDGKYLSNCHNLLANYGWNGVMIEASAKKFQELKKTYQGNTKVHLINRFVSFDGADTLDNILSTTPIPNDLDLLSIDIDGNDYYIWESVVTYSPKVVVIEFNQTIPSDVEFVQEKNVKVNQGAGILSITELGKSRGYELIAATICNAIFVRKEYFGLFGIEDNRPAILWDQETEAPRVFQLYDGTIALSKEFELLWNNVNVKRYDLQKLPRYLRVFSDSQGFRGLFRKFLFKVYSKRK